MREDISMGRYWLHIIGWSTLLTVPLIALGVLAASVDHLREDAGGTRDYLMIAGSLLVGGVASYFLWRWFPDFTMGEPRTPRGNRMRWVLVGVVVLSVAISVPILATGDVGEGQHPLFSNGPVPR